MTEKAPYFRLIGYAHVSTYGQILDVQLGQSKLAECARILQEKLTVTRIDRLPRSTFDLFAIVKLIADSRPISGHWPIHRRKPTPAPVALC